MVLIGLTLATAPVAAQPDSLAAKPRRGGVTIVPLTSFFLPGFGQYVQGTPARGLLFSTLAVAGTAIGTHAASDPGTDLPRSPEAQRRELGFEAYMVAGGLSAYDAFRHELPARQRQGQYHFLRSHEPIGRVLNAPFDPSFLKRWTTWIDLGYTALITTIVVADRSKPGVRSLPFQAHDAGYAVGISAGAAWSEEALFRGWIFPVLQQQLGEQSVLPNAIQAGAFAALHLPNRPGRFIAVIGGWALYEGWLTRRNGGSIRESTFHHFWYDTAVFIAALATEAGPASMVFSVPFRL